MGGVSGAIIGSIFDQIGDTINQSMTETLTLDEKSAEYRANDERRRDYGLTVADRVTKHQGVQIEKVSIQSIKEKTGGCIINTSIPDLGELTFFGKDDSHKYEIVSSISQWYDGHLTRHRGDIEGANVGLNIKDFMATFESAEKQGLSTSLISCIASDTYYVERFISVLFEDTTQRSRKIFIEWVRVNAPALHDILKKGIHKIRSQKLKLIKRLGLIIGGVAVLSVLAVIYTPSGWVPLVILIWVLTLIGWLVSIFAFVVILTEVLNLFIDRRRLKKLG